MEQPKTKFGVDEMTMSINRKSPEQKTEDWHCDFDAKFVVNGETYYGNLYDKKGDGSWIAGKLKKAPPKADSQQSAPPPMQQPAQQAVDDDIPF